MAQRLRERPLVLDVEVHQTGVSATVAAQAACTATQPSRRPAGVVELSPGAPVNSASAEDTTSTPLTTASRKDVAVDVRPATSTLRIVTPRTSARAQRRPPSST